MSNSVQIDTDPEIHRAPGEVAQRQNSHEAEKVQDGGAVIIK